MGWTSPERRREWFRDHYRKLRAGWAEAGLCSRCGKAPCGLKFKSCAQCRQIASARQRAAHARGYRKPGWAYAVRGS